MQLCLEEDRERKDSATVTTVATGISVKLQAFAICQGADLLSIEYLVSGIVHTQPEYSPC